MRTFPIYLMFIACGPRYVAPPTPPLTPLVMVSEVDFSLVDDFQSVVDEMVVDEGERPLVGIGSSDRAYTIKHDLERFKDDKEFVRLGMCEPAFKLITIGDVPQGLRREVIAHELGHALGFDHDAGGIMGPGPVDCTDLSPGACLVRLVKERKEKE